jgi:hypothetical protein
MHASVERYLEHLAAQGRSPHTRKAARGDLARFAGWWAATRRHTFDPALLRHEDVRDWRRARQRTTAPPPPPSTAPSPRYAATSPGPSPRGCSTRTPVPAGWLIRLLCGG